MHLCSEEILAFVAVVPWIGAGMVWVRMKWTTWRQKGRA